MAAAQSKINKLGIANPSLKLFIHKYENSAGIDWNKIKSSEDIENHISNILLPSLYEKIDFSSEKNNYIKPEQVDIPREYKNNPNDPIVRQAYQAYQQDPQRATNAFLEHLNYDKKNAFHEWKDYLNEEELYNNDPAFMYSVLKPIIDSSPETTKAGPPPLNGEALAGIWDEINNQGVTQMNVLKKYRKISSKLDREGIQSVSAEGDNEWIRIPSKISDPQNYKDNLAKLKRFAQGTGWCIARDHHSSLYLSQGDFWLYLIGGRPVVAIRMIGDKVQEIRGHNNNFKNLESYWQETIDFLHKSNFDYKDNVQYKKLEEIFLMNTNLEKGSPNYNIVFEKIQKDHKVYLRLSDENRQKFPEFLEIAKEGYRQELNDYLLKIEAPGLDENQYLRQFEKFQDYYNNLPPEIKNVLGDMSNRILQAHKKAYYNNPNIFPEFSTEMQQQFSNDEQIAAWKNYITQDPYHYNDKRIPSEVRQYFSPDNIKDQWIRLIQKNAEHIDYIPPEIFNLFNPGEVENYVLQDFASFPVSFVHGKMDKLERVENLAAQGKINRQQIIDILSNSIRSHPEWMDRLPANYKDEILGKDGNIKNIIEEGRMKHIVRDIGYFKSLPVDSQNTLLQQYGKEIGVAFAREKNRYRGLLHEFWVNTPENVRQYLPYDVIEETAQYYANLINNNPSNFESMLAKIPPDIQPYVFTKLSSGKNWYKTAQELSYVDIGHSIPGQVKLLDKPNYIWVYYNGELLVEEETEEIFGHGEAFERYDIRYGFVYSGRFESSTGRLSLSKPEMGPAKFRDIPVTLARLLYREFPIKTIHEFN